MPRNKKANLKIVSNQVMPDITGKKCAPHIWRKFSDMEKKLWAVLYEEFSELKLFPESMQGSNFVEERKAIAHNLASVAVWVLQDVALIKKDEV